MSTVQNGDLSGMSGEFSEETIGPDLYAGTSGIAVFLGDLFARTGTRSFARIAEAASRFALARLDLIPRRFRIGFYAGDIGVAYAAFRVGRCIDRPDLVEQATRLLDSLATDALDDSVLDVISGAAGAITPLFLLGDWHGGGRWDPLAHRLGERIMAAAHRHDDAWSWGEDATGFVTDRDLTGFGHGAAGIGWSLLELFARSGDTRYRDAGLRAFGFENRWFDAARDNWPDFRFVRDDDEAAPFGLAWCLGAPGIGLSRIRALAICPSADLRRDAEAAIRAVARRMRATTSLGTEDFSLCHGWAGIGDFLMDADRALPETDAGHLLETIAVDGAAHNSTSPEKWHSGMQRGYSPSLMLGLAGVGYFYLRLADSAVPSILLPTPSPTAAQDSPDS